MREKLLRRGTGIAMLALSVLAGPGITSARAGDVTKVPVTDIVTGEVLGSARLLRTNSGLSVELVTGDLVSHDAYTMWWILSNADGSFQLVTNASGGLAGSDGRGNFASHVSVGELPPVDGLLTLTAVGDSFDDPYGVSVMIVVRSHGPVIPGKQFEQTHWFPGGCPPNDCEDVQQAFFPGR